MTTKAIPIEQSYLEKVFRCDFYTNVLERKFKSGKWKVVDENPNKLGYSQVWFDGRLVYVHRLIYTLAHGNIDENFHIDHWDGNPENNALSNLQPLSHQDNINKSKSGLKPSFDGENGKYRVQAWAEFEGKSRSFQFKCFKEKSDAQKLCDTFNAQFGWNKPLYSARTGTPEKWYKYMNNFKSQYVN